MNITQRNRLIRDKVGNRQLCWYGVRGIDAPPLAPYGELGHIYSQTAPIYADTGIYEKSMESILMHRVDLNTYNIDEDYDHHAREFKRTILFNVKRETILIPYRPQEFLASVYFPHHDTIHYFGLFHKYQRPFEHKPWVERSLSDAGVSVIPWEYVRNIERDMVRKKLADGRTLLIRPPYSSGGAGYTIIRKIEDLYTNPVSSSEDGFFSVSPFFDDSIPININGCIYENGDVSVFLPSYQLIGIQSATNRHLGYCGNDFGVIKQFDGKIIDTIEKITHQIGLWLAKKKYKGQFGADLLIVNGMIYMVEINARFQGSTMLAAALANQIEDPNPYGEHLAAFLQFNAPQIPPLRERIKNMDNASQLVIYNTQPRDITLNASVIERLTPEYQGLPRHLVTVAPEAMIFRKQFKHSITTDGYSLFPEIARQLKKDLDQLIH